MVLQSPGASSSDQEFTSSSAFETSDDSDTDRQSELTEIEVPRRVTRLEQLRKYILKLFSM
jgi:hypothetical protein